MQQSGKIYTGIDYGKLFCAVGIVFMHTCHGGSELALWFRDVITCMCVPYFFIVSGFFLTKGLIKNAPPNRTSSVISFVY